MTDPGGALTRTTRDVYGRVKRLDDPDQGTTFSKYDGFGELISSTDALGRIMTREYDGLGRPQSRVDHHGTEILTTTSLRTTMPTGICSPYATARQT